MGRLEQLRQVIDEIIRQNPDPEDSRCGFVHLYGVSAICTLLAYRRDLDPELCAAAGMLHDIWSYKFRPTPEHGPLGAVEAEKILKELGTFSQAEIDLICDAIAKHSEKKSVDGEVAELLKDADVLQHYLYNPGLFAAAASLHSWQPSETERKQFHRLDTVLSELGI